MGLIRIAFRALAGSVREDREFTLLKTRKIVVRTRRHAELDVSVDVSCAASSRRCIFPLCHALCAYSRHE